MEQVTHHFPFEVSLTHTPKATCECIQEAGPTLYLASDPTFVPYRGKVIYLLCSQGNRVEVQVMTPHDTPPLLREALCRPLHVPSVGNDLILATYNQGLYLTLGTVEGPTPEDSLEAALSVIPQLGDRIAAWISSRGNSLGMSGWKLLKGVYSYEDD